VHASGKNLFEATRYYYNWVIISDVAQNGNHVRWAVQALVPTAASNKERLARVWGLHLC